jgi:hypothetical protein
VRAVACIIQRMNSSTSAYTQMAATAKSALASSTAASHAAWLSMACSRLRSQNAPMDMPRMNAASITSKECVEAPRPSESMRIHVIS